MARCHIRRYVSTVALLALCVLFATALASVEQGVRYDTKTAENGWRYSRIATCPLNNVIRWDCGEPCKSIPGFELYGLHLNRMTNTVVYTGVNRDTKEIVVVFRCSSDMQNAVSTLDFDLVPYTTDSDFKNVDTTGWEVNSGFQKAYLSLRSIILEDLSELHAKHITYTVFLTGHSLGGAMATLCAVDLMALSWPIDIPVAEEELLTQLDAPLSGDDDRPAMTITDVDQISSFWKAQRDSMPSYISKGNSTNATRPTIKAYTYGAPRVGNAVFAEAASQLLRKENSTYLRITHARDPIPHLPPLSAGFLHIPTEIFLNGTTADFATNSIGCKDTGAKEDPNCIFGILGLSPLDHQSYMGSCASCECGVASPPEQMPFELSWAQALEITKEHATFMP